MELTGDGGLWGLHILGTVEREFSRLVKNYRPLLMKSLGDSGLVSLVDGSMNSRSVESSQ